jgi:very-short-patch-repair endonuclease
MKSVLKGGDMMHRKNQGNNHSKFRQARKFRKEMTESERRLWEKLRGNRLLGMHFRRQHVVHGFIVDFYCHEARLVIEVDGAIHHSTQNRDIEREKIIESLEMKIIRFSNEQVDQNIEGVISEIEKWCEKVSPR